MNYVAKCGPPQNQFDETGFLKEPGAREEVAKHAPDE